jgi:lipopolysaccharide/colanic/teichoic acid biosynthesis glycosyltransferase
VYFVNKFNREIDSYIERFKVKPGLTGLAQIQGYYHTKPEIKLKYDLSYIYNWSIWLELRILLETIKVVFTIGGH